MTAIESSQIQPADITSTWHSGNGFPSRHSPLTTQLQSENLLSTNSAKKPSRNICVETVMKKSKFVRGFNDLYGLSDLY